MENNCKIVKTSVDENEFSIFVGKICVAVVSKKNYNQVKWDLLSDFVAEDITKEVFIKKWKAI